MPSLEEEIARHLELAARKGELQAAEGYGKPLTENEGWRDTPSDLRMPFKILKDAGAAPPEIALFHERARLRALVSGALSDAQRETAQQQLSELEQKIALRLEAMRGGKL
jgi:hypothetical protein